MQLELHDDVSQDPSRSALSGSVERIIYFNAETGQCVLEIRPLGEKNSVYIAGFTPWVSPGLTAHFEWDAATAVSPWRAENLTFSPPANERATRKFLRSGSLPGVGPQLAKILAKAFPQNLFDVLGGEPKRLLDVQGIGKKKQTQISESWAEYRGKRDFFDFLFEEKLPLNWAEDLWLRHGMRSLEEFRARPYETVFKNSFAFDLVDSFALRHGFALDSPERLEAGLKNKILSAYRQGHCAIPEKEVLEEVTAQLEVPRALIEDTLELEILEGRVVVDDVRGTTCLYMKEIWDLERHVAEKLIAFQNKEAPWGMVNTPKLLGWAQNILKIQLAPLQRYAIETALTSSLTVITGGPGTGKTTLIRSLVTILQTQFAQFALCSPTGRAAQRLGEATSMPARTIHRLLKYDGFTGRFGYNKDNPLPIDLLLVDEASMVDLALMGALLDALPEHCALILVGDADQIPSVGAGNVLSSLIDSGRFEVVRLTEIYRQGQHSLIKENAKRINEGLMPNLPRGTSGDFHYIPVKDAAQAKTVLTDLVKRVIPEVCGIKNLAEFQILTPLNRGPLGAEQLNKDLQRDISGESARETSAFGQNFKPGDKVMVLKNDYTKDVFNGDIGFIRSIDHDEQYLNVQFDERLVRFEFYEMDRLTLAYAISIHKSQGSEYRAAVVVVTNDHLPMAQRHLIYTAVTRGKEHVFLVAEPRALLSAVQSVEQRWEKLTELLRTENAPERRDDVEFEPITPVF